MGKIPQKSNMLHTWALIVLAGLFNISKFGSGSFFFSSFSFSPSLSFSPSFSPAGVEVDGFSVDLSPFFSVLSSAFSSYRKSKIKTYEQIHVVAVDIIMDFLERMQEYLGIITMKSLQYYKDRHDTAPVSALLRYFDKGFIQ